jgi:hypothetical protein
MTVKFHLKINYKKKKRKKKKEEEEEFTGQLSIL